MIIIGITGTLGAGKGTIVDYLVEKKGFIHYSVREFISIEIRKRQWKVDRDHMVIVANELRAIHGPSYIVDCLYQEAIESGKNCIIESIRTPGEIHSLREKGRFILLAVDAKPELRYERIRLRNSETDQVSFETFLANEKLEMDSTDLNKQNIRRCIAMADCCLLNNSSKADLLLETEEILKQFLN